MHVRAVAAFRHFNYRIDAIKISLFRHRVVSFGRQFFTARTSVKIVFFISISSCHLGFLLGASDENLIFHFDFSGAEAMALGYRHKTMPYCVI